MIESENQLYNMVDDPSEKKNVIAEHREVAKVLKMKLEECKNQNNSRN